MEHTSEATEERTRAAALLDRYRVVRAQTDRLCEPLTPEDCVVQSMPDVSPTRWHLAHTTWFFETFLLGEAVPGYRPFHPAYAVLFNSYYNAVGEQFPRPRRGLLSRPTVEEVFAYRRHVDDRVQALLADGGDAVPDPVLAIVELGLHHEQQHQELMLMDIQHVFSMNPLHPVYREPEVRTAPPAAPSSWVSFAEGIRHVGRETEAFAFDNEGPRHRVFLDAFELATRPVTNAEYIAFMEDGGYGRPELWLSDGWTMVKAEGIEAPLYWDRHEGAWWRFGLTGYGPVDLEAPVCHLSYFEADAFASWAGARLPTEAEWETAAEGLPIRGNFVENGRFAPEPEVEAGEGLRQMYGDVWEWTASPYEPYPGYRPVEGALGEYNGKFMCNQYVLRGGCCVTPADHVRRTYRNFYGPHTRWHFSGIRLAR
ncbi:MAG: ergothioneine biosynthesis protein EgtB [Planctomycetota bacterium]|jgi:ergothioneine biosynthesis protein EgtB